jgi:hypothetical protein
MQYGLEANLIACLESLEPQTLGLHPDWLRKNIEAWKRDFRGILEPDDVEAHVFMAIWSKRPQIQANAENPHAYTYSVCYRLLVRKVALAIRTPDS